MLGCMALLLGSRSIQVQAQEHLPFGSVPALVNSSQAVGEVDRGETISIALVLPLQNQAGLEDLIRHLYDPFDPLYGRYLTTTEFEDLFAPTEVDYAALQDWARGQGLTVTTHPNRLLLDITADAATLQHVFSVRLMRYRTPEGRIFRAPDREPVLPSEVAARIAGVVGLDTATVPHNRLVHRKGGTIRPEAPAGNGYGPADIAKAYDLDNLLLKDGKTPIDGSGQVLGLFELDVYSSKDIQAYEKQFFPTRVSSGKLPKLQNVPVDGFSGATGQGSDEVTLDIELQIALAPGASKVLVYQAPGNSNSQWLDCYNKIATDNLAQSISTSWGQGPGETSPGAAYIYGENAIFAEMAAQGQSMYDAAGDWGCYTTDYSKVAVDDPTSPYMVTVGGTSLTVDASTGAWKSETTWNDFAQQGKQGGGGGGGISTVYEIPDYQAQAGVITAASHASTTARNMPDVSLNADENTGYAIYYQGGWTGYGGTSCAAPLWAAFNALVNQKRAVDNSAPLNAPLGFACPAIYAAALSHPTDFHDIADGSTNGYKKILNFAGYPATTGFDDATGWGTFVGAKLLADLAGDPEGIVTELLGDPGFEGGSTLHTPWTATGKIITNSTKEPAHSGSWYVWFGGTTKAQTSTLQQTVQLPANLTAGSLSFWLHIDTAETGTKALDTLTVAFKNKAGKVIATLATYSNVNAATGYTQVSFDLTKAFKLSTYANQPITLVLTGVQKGTKQTSFVVDDFSLTVAP
jgi:kumamolisin